ncbi:glycosyltransferase [Xanthobacteraceae bacterium A53D]
MIDDGSVYRETVPFWRDDAEVQNFGDFLTPYLMEKLFLRTPRLPGDIRIIGSCLEDGFVDQAEARRREAQAPRGAALTAWGTGVREPGSLSAERRKNVDLLAVRGPLSVRELGLPDDFPIGDPGLLVPALYRPLEDPRVTGHALCVPHFHDTRGDDELIAVTGATRILRPNIPKDLREIEVFIDTLTSADFVLCGSLHAAILAAAYGRPFAYWESGCVDLPFKWQDFSASVGIDCIFCPDVASGRAAYEQQIRAALKLPALWQLLAAAPFPVRPEALIRLLSHFAATDDAERARLAAIAAVFETGRADADRIAADADALVRHYWQELRGTQRNSPARSLRIGLLRGLAGLIGPVSARSAARFRRSADKRDLRKTARLPAPALQDGRISLPPVAKVAGVVSVPTSERPKVSVIVPVDGQPEAAIGCVAALAAHPPQSGIEVIVLADGPTDRLSAALSGARIVSAAGGTGLSAFGAASGQARGAYLLLLPPDARLLPGAIDALLAALEADADIAMAGGRILHSDGSLREAGGIVWRDGTGTSIGHGATPHRPEYTYRRTVDRVSATGALVRADAFAALGGFSGDFASAFGAEADLAFHLRAQGRHVVFVPDAVVLHGQRQGDAGKDAATALEADAALLRARHPGDLARQFPPGQDVLRAKERGMGAPVILMIDHDVPTPDRDAGSRTTLAFLRELKGLGFVVKYWPHDRGYRPGYTADLEALGIEMVDGRWPGSFAEWIAEHGGALDHALVCRPNVAIDVTDALVTGTSARLSYYGHDLHYVRMRRQAAVTGDDALRAAADAMARTERDIWRRYDTVIHLSATETAIVEREVPGCRARTILSVSFDSFTRRSAPPPGRTLAFIAGFSHLPNIDAAEFLVREVMPLVWAQAEDARLLIIGSNPTEAVRALAQKRVEVTGWVSDARLTQYYDEVRLAVAPLRFGAGVKIKVVEAMSLGLPIITTAIGAEGLVDVAQAIPVHDGAPEIAASILRLLTDDAAWAATSAAETAYAERHFSRTAMAAALKEALAVDVPAADGDPVERIG